MQGVKITNPLRRFRVLISQVQGGGREKQVMLQIFPGSGTFGQTVSGTRDYFENLPVFGTRNHMKTFV